MTAPALTITGTSPFKQASRPHQCASPWPCEDIATGQRGGYASTSDGLLTVCGPCLDRIVAGELPAPEPDAQVEPTEAPEQPADPESLVTPPLEQLAAADLDPWPGALCKCPSRATGFSRDRATGRWVHNDCGRPALRFEDGRADGADWSARDTEWDTNGAHRDDVPTDDVEGDDPADDADVPECACAKVTKRAKFGRTPDGRPTHKSCGGVLREKHRHLLPEDDQPDQTEAHPDDQPAADAGDPDGAAGSTDPGRGSGAGVEARPDDGAARDGEGRSEGGEGEVGGAVGVDQGGSVPAGPGGVGLGDHPEPAHDEPVQGEPARGVAVRLEGVQASGPADVGALGEQGDRVPPRRDGVGLAAFYGQPVEDDEVPQTSPSLPPASTASAGRPEGEEALRAVGSLAAFYRQPTDDEADEVVWQRPPSDPEARIRFALHELGVRNGGVVTALVVWPEGAQYPEVVAVPR